MSHRGPILIILALISSGSLSASAALAMETVLVGNAKNANDHSGYGAVSYEYRIGKYEVTLGQYAAFLNAVPAADPHQLYHEEMGCNRNIMGIARCGAAGSYTYAVIGSSNRPVTYVTWFDAARFANWLHNGQPTGAQTAATTERGAYSLDGTMVGIIRRNDLWKFGLPSENEWYKAAYHQPVGQAGDADDYWAYPTASNVIPNSRNGSATDRNSGKIRRDDGMTNGYNGGWAVNNSGVFPTDNALTEAGSFKLADSYYGTFDQGGNVLEWNDAIIEAARGMRGGGWLSFAGNLRAGDRFCFDQTFESCSLGFRAVEALGD